MTFHMGPTRTTKRPGKHALPVVITALAAGLLLLSGCADGDRSAALAQAKDLSGVNAEAIQQAVSALSAAPGTSVVQEGTPAATDESGTPDVWLTPDSETPVPTAGTVVVPDGTPAPLAGTTVPDVVIQGSESRWITDTVHPIEYRGIVDMMPGNVLSGTLTIGGHLVRVGPDTDLKEQLGAIEQGAYVQVIGKLLPDGSIEARKLLVKKFQPGQGNKEATASGTPTVDADATPSGTPTVDDEEFLDDETGVADPEEIDDQVDNIGGRRGWDTYLKGEVVTGTTGMTGTLMVDGHRVTVDESTWVKAMGALAEGHRVHIKGILQPDGTILASSIQWVHRTPNQDGQQPGQGNGQTKDKNKAKNETLTTPVPGAGSSQIQAPKSGQGNNKNRSIKPPTPSNRSGKSSGKGVTPIAGSQGRGNGNGRK